MPSTLRERDARIMRTTQRRAHRGTARVLPAVLVVTVGLGLPALAARSAPAASAPGRTSAARQPVLTPCTGIDVAAVCGQITVPLDRAHPASGSTTVAFALLRRRDTSQPSLGTIAYNPGGPGGGVIAQAGNLAMLFGPLLEYRDVLLVDPPGTGRSAPLDCPGLTPALEFGPTAGVDAAVGACGQQLGAQVGDYGTDAVADDLDDVRTALGIDKLDLWGESYGTYLMQVYAVRHPQHIRSIVLSGTYPIDFDPWGRDRAAASRRAIDLTCGRSGQKCQGSTVLAEIQALGAQLSRHPVAFTVSAGSSQFPTALNPGTLASVVYEASSDTTMYGQIPAAVASALSGDYAPLEQLVARARLPIAQLLTDSPVITQYFDPAQNSATSCHDYPRVYSYADPIPVREATYARALDALNPAAFYPFSPTAWTQSGIEGVDSCVDWPDDAGAGAPIPPGARMPDVPVLVLSGDLDANTPSSDGRRVAAEFPRGQFVEVPDVGHTPTDGDTCGVTVGLAFIRTLSVAANACVGTGTPPVVTAQDPRTAAGIQPVSDGGTVAQRRAVGLVVATSADLEDQLDIIDNWGGAAGLRGGEYTAQDDGSITLAAVQVVGDATVSGSLTPSDTGVSGTVTLTGPGVASGTLTVALTLDGHGTASGTLAGARVDISF